MLMPKLYLLRHGQIDASKAGCFIGQTDAALSPEGRRQAEAWRGTLKDVKPAAVWTSDLARAEETARIVFADHRVAVQSCADLREIRLGDWEGLPRQQVKKNRPDLWRARGNDLAGFRPPGGESFQDLQARAVRQVEQILSEGSGNVWVVTHAGVIRCLICHFLQIPLSHLFRIRVDYAGLSIVSYAPDRIEICGLNRQLSNLIR
jgi:probable phosphoglycerate mutase